jgi:peptide/nickel transport system ATP-binding protein
MFPLPKVINLTEEILTVKNLKKYFATSHGTVKAIDDISFSVRHGEIFGLVGESGSGKSTTVYTIMGAYEPTSGEITFEGVNLSMGIKKRPKSLKKKLQIVFQDPGSSLNPKKTVQQILELPLKVHGLASNRDCKEKVVQLLKMIELPADYMYRYPRELSGGEKQRVAIARALAPNPSFLLLDEPTSALDVSVQAYVINMLMRFRSELGLSYLFITHNLCLIRNVASRVAIMYLGKICEVAPASEFFRNPLHPYTRMLLSSIPVITTDEENLKPKKTISIGEIPSPVNVPLGCAFHPRCLEKTEICSKYDPVMLEPEEGHAVRCHLYD